MTEIRDLRKAELISEIMFQIGVDTERKDYECREVTRAHLVNIALFVRLMICLLERDELVALAEEGYPCP